MRSGLLACCAFVLWLGCSSPAPQPNRGAAGGRAPAPTNSTGLTVTPATGVTGKVVHVNPRGRFVVLSYPLGQLPRPERLLNVYRGGLKVGELKVSKEQRDQNVVADITAGEAQVGDVVREN